MISIDRFAEILDEIANALPESFYDRLNGGIQIDEAEKIHPQSGNGQLRILGQYNAVRAMGRAIVIYYGSFAALYANRDEAFWRTEMEKVLRHEFLHHLESLAGESSLIDEDRETLSAYLGESD